MNVALSALVALAVAMGIGRFAFTPLLPMMQADAGLTLSQGAWLASANYAGYLAGALSASRVTPAAGIRGRLARLPRLHGLRRSLEVVVAAARRRGADCLLVPFPKNRCRRKKRRQRFRADRLGPGRALRRLRLRLHHSGYFHPGDGETGD